MIRKTILIALVPMTLILQGAFVMKKGEPLQKADQEITTITEETTPIKTQPTSTTTQTTPTQTQNTSSLGKKIYEVNFNNNKIGQYTMDMLKKDFGSFQGTKVDIAGATGPGETLSIVEDNNEKVLRVLYKKNQIGTGKYPDIRTYTGFLTIISIPEKIRPKEDINNPQDVTLEYSVKFENNFQWTKGGKLPGLAGGSIPSGGEYIGKGRMTNGFSARFMWHVEKGKPGLISYIYHPGRSGSYGQKVYGTGPFLSVSKPATSLNSRDGNAMLKLSKNKWYKIRQTIKANTPGKHNGTMKVWINNQLAASFGGMKYIADGHHGSYSVDKMFFATFYGGDITYAPTSNTNTRFKDIKIYVK